MRVHPSPHQGFDLDMLPADIASQIRNHAGRADDLDGMLAGKFMSLSGSGIPKLPSGDEQPARPRIITPTSAARTSKCRRNMRLHEQRRRFFGIRN